MSTKDRAAYIFERLSEEQLEAFVTLFGRTYIPEEEPDEWDKEMIERSKNDTSESIPLEQAAKEMGFNLDDL
ncbi:MAG: hypothetical protein K2J77_00505 [Oscillospiraceae bacterium]|nr:hypothetical protein [Oscillospiraceae bacterium]